MRGIQLERFLSHGGFRIDGMGHVGLAQSNNAIHVVCSSTFSVRSFRKISPNGAIWRSSSLPSRVSSSAAENMLAIALRRLTPLAQSGGRNRLSRLQLGIFPSILSILARASSMRKIGG